MAMSDYEKRVKETNDRFSTCEFDVDTGTYIEDVRGNDFIGSDKDGDGLIDDVEKFVEEYYERSDEYNAEQDRIRYENVVSKQNTEKPEEEKDDNAFDLGV